MTKHITVTVEANRYGRIPLSTSKMLPGTGDFDPPDDDEGPECEVCEGTRYVDGELCGACNGTGYAEVDNTP